MTQEPIINESEITSDDKLWAALSYATIGLVALIALLIEDKKARPYIKFHAVQSLTASVVFVVFVTIIAAITVGLGALCIGPLLWFIFLYWAYKAYQGEYFDIPVLTDFIKGQGWA